MPQFGGELRPADLDALCPSSRHASSSPFADLLRLDLSERRLYLEVCDAGSDLREGIGK
jgi:hypothetical protein